jgi:hypothetical protein
MSFSVPRRPERAVFRFAALSAAFLAGCATAETSPLARPTPDTQTVTVQGEEGSFEATLRRDDFVSRADLPAGRAAAWQHLQEVWAEIGLPEPLADRRSYTLVIANQLIQRRLGRTPLSAYLDCGSSMTGAHADTHRIRLTVQSMLERIDESATRLHTRVDATAQSTGGASAPVMQCSSRGSLEGLIARTLRERLD